MTGLNTIPIPVLMSFLPLVHWCAPFHNIILSSLQYQYSLINLSCHRIDHQMTHIRSFRVHPFSNGLMTFKDVVSSAPSPTYDSPTYSDQDPSGPDICSGTNQCRGKGEIWGAPVCMIGLSVDDGPVGDPDATPRLYGFLKERNRKISHFMIGTNSRDCPPVSLRAFHELEDHIGVHTCNHPYMTTFTSGEAVAEIGQIIHDSTGGRVPRYWRPYGDAGNRVRAIASEGFGLTSVIWNRDTSDWSLSTNDIALENIQDQFKEWLAGPRPPGLVILKNEI